MTEAALLAGASAQAGEAQALRRAVAERLEQHRRNRGQRPHGQAAAPAMHAGTDARWTTGKPSRVADSVAARFAKSQSYREFLQQEAETATRQAEAAAEIARRNAEAIAGAQQQLLDEMREWENRERASAPVDSHAGLDATAPESTTADAGVLLPMPLPAPEPVEPAQEVTLLAPSEALRVVAEPAAVAQAVSRPASIVEEVRVAAPALSRGEAMAVPSISFALPAAEPSEPPTPIPANLIEFPRQLVAARKARPRLAEGPLRDDADLPVERAQLRIFEVEASSFSTATAEEPASSLPEWSSIRLDSWTAPHDTAQPDAQVSLTLPVYAAPLERRVMAAAVDGCCIAAAFLIAVAAAGLAGGALPTGMFAAGASAVTLLLFGVGYMLLCTTLSGQTVGMRYARIALCTFGDDNPTRSAMRRRLFAMGLSGVSLGLGFAWALLDDDKLGWHDRISRMYQRAY